LAKHQLQPEQVALVVAHQANLRINQLLGQQLGLAEEKIFNTIQLYGNTTAATIPIGMTDAICSQRIKKDDYVLMPAFGSGFVWGAALLRVLCCALMWCGLLALSESAGAEGKKSEPKKSAGSEAGKAVVPVVAIPPPEVAVRSEVYYRWKPAEQALVGSVGDSALEVLFQEVTAAAPTKEQAIAKLQEQLTLVQFEARHYCQKQHESKAGCLQSKIALMAEQFRSMDFASRKAVKDSIERDCNRQFGTCLVAKIADIEVVEAALPSDLKVGEPVAGSDTPAVAATVLAPDGTAVKPGAAAAIANDPAADRKLPEEEPSAFGLQ